MNIASNTLDERDTCIRDARIAAWNLRPGPRVGDFCEFPDGRLERFTHDHGDRIQTTARGFGGGSFYLGEDYMEYSGALDPSLPKAMLEEIPGRFEYGAAWFFHHNEHKAHNGVPCRVKCRVFRVKAAATQRRAA